MAQDDGGPGGPPPGQAIVVGPGGPGGNWDPAEFQKRMMEGCKRSLEVTNDDEWAVIQPLVQKVMDARRDGEDRGGLMMFGPGGPPGFARQADSAGGSRDDRAPRSNDQGGRRNRNGFGPPPSPEKQALQDALEKNASTADIKAALEKYRAARKDKQAKLEDAQEHLKSVLTAKQEAQAVVMGLLK